MSRLIRCLFALSVGLFLTQCIITRGVKSSGLPRGVKHVCVVRNPEVHHDEGLHPEMLKQIRALGYQPHSVDRPPEDGSYYLLYTANWRWEVALYLRYFRAELMQDGRSLGAAEYDTGMGNLHVGKFGPTADKIRPLLQRLLEP